MTTITLTDDARRAIVWALVEDLSTLAESLTDECENASNAKIGFEYLRAADVAGIAQQIGTLAGPLAELADAARQEVK